MDQIRNVAEIGGTSKPEVRSETGNQKIAHAPLPFIGFE
jgi:hypothetical protein